MKEFKFFFFITLLNFSFTWLVSWNLANINLIAYFQEFVCYSRSWDLLLFNIMQGKGQHWSDLTMAHRTFQIRWTLTTQFKGCLRNAKCGSLLLHMTKNENRNCSYFSSIVTLPPAILAESVDKFKFSLDLLPYLVPFLQIFQKCFARISNEKYLTPLPLS